MILLILTLDPAVIRATDDRLDKLIRNPILIPLLYRLDQIILSTLLIPFTLHQRIHGNLDPVPSLIPVHSEIPADNSRYLPQANLLDIVKNLLDILSRRLGSGISTITEEVDVDVLDLVRFGASEEGEQVEDVGMDTAI